MPLEALERAARGKRVKPKRRYSDKQKAEALAALDAKGGNVNGTAKALNVPRGTLTRWAKGETLHEAVTLLRQQKRNDLASAFEDAAWELMALLLARPEEVPPGQRMTSAAIAVDKMRLLRDQPTEITQSEVRQKRVSIIVKDAESRRFLAELEERLAIAGEGNTGGAGLVSQQGPVGAGGSPETGEQGAP